MDYDEDEAMKKVMALSLETAKEDDKRRKDKYGIGSSRGSSTPSPTLGNQVKNPPPREGSTGTSIISRPRPQSRVGGQTMGGKDRSSGISTATPVVPPRPDSKTLQDARSSRAHLHTTSTKPNNRQSPPQRPPPPKTTSSASSPKKSPLAKDTDAPLIMLSPSPNSTQAQKNKKDLFDFDLESLDPLNNPAAALPRSTSAEFNSSGKPAVSQPNHSTAWHSSDLTHRNTNTSDTKWAKFSTPPSLPNSTPQSSIPQNPFLSQQIAAPQAPQTGFFQNFGSAGLSGPASNLYTRVPTGAGVFYNRGAESLGFGTNSLHRVPSDHESVSQPQQSSTPTPGQSGTALNKHLILPSPLTRTPSDSSLYKNSSSTPTENHSALPRVPSQPNMQQKSTSTPDPQMVPSNASDLSRLSSNRSERMTSNTSDISDSDLMGFPDAFRKEEEFLSLESFDPLYNLSETLDSTGLCTNPYDNFKQNETTDALSTKVVQGDVGGAIKEGARHYNAIDVVELEKQLDITDSPPKKGDPVQPTAATASPGHRRNESSGSTELLDPFSFSDLMVSLEKKRRKHVAEQEERKALLREKQDNVSRGDRPKKMTEGELLDAGAAPTEKEGKRPSRTISHIAKGRESTYECLQRYNEAAQDEVKAFCDMVARLKLQYPHSHPSNKGIVISPRTDYPAFVHMTVKVKVTASFMKEPVTFTPSLEVTVQHAIAEVLHTVTDDVHSDSAQDYILKVFGKAEYLISVSQLGDYEYVQNCLKLDEDIKLVLVDLPHLERPLLRTVVDDRQAVLVPKHKEMDDSAVKLTREKLNILMETFYGEVEKLRDQAIQQGCHKVQCRSVIQAVKAICAVLYRIETIDVIRAIQKLCGVTMEKGLKVSSPKNQDSFMYVTADGELQLAVEDVDKESMTNLDDLHLALEDLTKAVKGQIDLFCRTFNTDFRFESATSNVKETQEISQLDETLLLHIATAHRVPLKWKSMFETFRVVCGVYYGGQKLCDEIVTQMTPSLATGLQDTYVWDEWLNFESLSLRSLPRESRLCLQLIGVKVSQSGDSSALRVNQNLGWVATQIFNHKFELVQGSQLLGFWHNENLNPVGTTMSAAAQFNHCVLLQCTLPDFDCDYVFPAVLDPLKGLESNFHTLHVNDQEQLHSICARTSLQRLSPMARSYLWDKRHFLHQDPKALTKVLHSVESWQSSGLREIYTMVNNWKALNPTEALALLLPMFPDTFVRTKAVEWLSALTDDQLLDLLPQLIQGLKFECYHTSALAKLLIERSVLSARIAHELYWLLKEAADDVHFRNRYQLVFGALLSVVGEAGRREFGKQEDLVKMLAAIAEKVKAAKDKENVLQREVFNMWEFFEHKTVCLPLNPALEVCGLDTQSCSYFSSNAFPLKLVFKNVDPKAESIYTMFKSGDDLRQDMITMQVIRIMDRLWRKDQLDLKIITFKCQASGSRKGLVELVTESDTLRKIQMKHGKGVAGSFKDTTIREWLQMQNPTELEYEKAVDNFIASCAGYCVATYVLGICDRHNDNIMVKQSGHLFHIDFGKFLGDSQMFGNIKRDRTPFVLTSDMAYVINGGDKPGHKFQHFVDLCCSAFNILRKHAAFFSNLFSMMVQSNIPGVNEQATKYVEKALLPEHSDTEAISIFTRSHLKLVISGCDHLTIQMASLYFLPLNNYITQRTSFRFGRIRFIGNYKSRMIEECLKSTFTQWNFFIHNLAQMKFSGHNEGALLSFIPKTYSINTDGKIAHVEVFGYQKRYNPEKYYIYIVKVDRENQKVSSFIFRRFSEFQELLHKLACQFPLVRLPTLSNKVILGRTHVKSVSEERKQELELCLRDLLKLSPEISEHDLVYTFFHPMLRDEQDIDKTNLQKLKERPTPHPQNRQIDGQIKLALFHKDGEFTVMVMHVKDLVGSSGEPPDPYVKLYLLPDPFKETKRKTKIIKGTFHPTFNEMLTYHMPVEELRTRTLSASVWSYDALSENEYLGSTLIRLADIDFTKETTKWYHLETKASLLS